ncbi:DUF6264 family protein [Cryobacterium fucosi]|uniref:Uncharacterized protein n=1 Tax=Cryobacterium fucosi TaxID=1259157 RepID=A0A4R9BG42_9MICO|nr:DUF6264 family protein [Cryobacterium fucosi]TFD83230.1 hypothetical protein E3T48_00600 [Cryobacterium fucosi]
MAENPLSTPAGNPPEDSRPRPQYGELAPEGWSWTPAPDAVAPTVPSATPTTSGPNQSAAQPSGVVPAWDRPLTLALLVFGLLATFFAIGVLGALPEAVQMLYTQQDLGDYTPAASVAGLITAGSFTEAVVWLASAVGAILLLVRGKRAFYVPLIGAVVAFVVIFVFMSVILATDPTLLNFYSQP